MTLHVRTLSREEHLAYVAGRPSVSFLQTPAWGRVKREWRSESLGWVDGSGTVVGAGLVLYRQVPRLRRYLAYLPEGPDLDWTGAVETGSLAGWLEPMAAHLEEHGAFGIRMGPPVVSRRWSANTVKAAIADDSSTRLWDVPADHTTAAGAALAAQLAALGWRPPAEEGGFSAGQPRYVFQVPLADRTEDDVLKGFNQLWRRNVKKAAKSGVEVTHGTADDLPAFHALYAETARRDGFTPRPLAYFDGMWQAMTGEAPERLRLYLARHEGDLVAATTMVRVGDHAWYSYGASSTAKREVRGSNAVQWRMIRDALAEKCSVYDLRGITETLSEDDPHFGLIRFKLGTGGEAVEYAGEWDLPISRLLHAAFDVYMKRRG
ncbi:MAG TPA: peptidoglycan bridge formation glycyltransferase FemA/FemB family protein [Jiangellales bacterium]|nr:peptidoglycan bridge formation glycyltransferase FemA/FemB family protein [Jiangellales bacterium]